MKDQVCGYWERDCQLTSTEKSVSLSNSHLRNDKSWYFISYEGIFSVCVYLQRDGEGLPKSGTSNK